MRKAILGLLCGLSFLAGFAPGAAAQPVAADAALIDSYYRTVLGREGDADGVAYWLRESERMRAHGADLNETWRVMALAFFNSAEYQARNVPNRDFIATLYSLFLGRAADAAGLDYWTGLLGGGIPRDAVILSFVFSAEFNTRMRSVFGDAGSRAEIDMIVDFYRGVLNRLPDDEGIRYWRSRFRAAQCTSAAAVAAEAESIARQFLASGEYAARARTNAQYVSDLYNAFMRRGAEIYGFNYWVDELRNNRRTREQIANGFRQGTEFQARVKRVADAGCIRLAQESQPAAFVQEPRPSPFIAHVEIGGRHMEAITGAIFTVQPRPGTVSRPVRVDASKAYLTLAGHGNVRPGVFRVPVFGLYAGYDNQVTLELQFEDGSTTTVATSVQTPPYVDEAGIYDRPTIRAPRPAGSSLGFDFFYFRTVGTSPLVMDTDGHVRWWMHTPYVGLSVLYDRGEFFVGEGNTMRMLRTRLDGFQDERVVAGDFFRFHHNIDPGKHGYLVEVDDVVDGVTIWESIQLEVDRDGNVLKMWDFGRIIADHMAANGDDPSGFVRHGVDWFHQNAAAYDPRDDSIVVSARELFVIKFDYATGAIRWILGDPTKHWYTYPSLRAKALTLEAGGLHPTGQHAVSIMPDGRLLLFNNGEGSLNHAEGTAPGESRTFSTLSAYTIDAVNRTAREVLSYDYARSIHSRFCSSVYESGGSLLAAYARADDGTKARVVGLDAALNVTFDFEFPNPRGCDSAYNASPIPFHDLVLR